MARLYCTDARHLPLPDGEVQCCVTSPPYFGLRDYGSDGQIGLEQSPQEYVDSLVAVFREVWRVLAEDGTVWLNLGDSYAAGGGVGGHGYTDGRSNRNERGRAPVSPELKQKDLVGIPWRVAFALQADGWYLRQDIIWHKPNPMPESVTDRCTKAHEYLFLLSKSQRYYYDGEAIRENQDVVGVRKGSGKPLGGVTGEGRQDRATFAEDKTWVGRNKRSVWTVTTKPYPGAHFATFPPKLIEPCILAGSREGDTVLDPFVGSGTSVEVALRHGRRAVGVDLSEDYLELAKKRIEQAREDIGLFLQSGNNDADTRTVMESE